MMSQVTTNNKNISENFLTRDNVLHLKINSNEINNNILLETLYKYNPDINDPEPYDPHNMSLKSLDSKEEEGNKKYDVNNLTPGDWIVNDIRIGGKKIYSTKDLGVSEEQIKKLKFLKQRGKIKQILVKEGVPFVPSFLMAFVVTLFVGNLLLIF